MWVTVDRETARHTGPPRASHTRPVRRSDRARPGRHTSLTEHGNGLALGAVGSAHDGDRFPETRRHRVPDPHVLASVGPARQRPWRAWRVGAAGGRRPRRRRRSVPMESGLPQLRQARMSGADLLYWRRKREQWRQLVEGAPDEATAEYLTAISSPPPSLRRLELTAQLGHNPEYAFVNARRRCGGDFQ